MTPVILLVVVFLSLLAIRALRGGPGSLRDCARWALGAMLVFTGVSHFVFVEPMSRMVPPPIPLAKLVVYLTGALEIVLGVLLGFRRFRLWTGPAVILLLIGLFPANIWAAINQTGLGGHRDGPGYLWIRTPIQLLFIAWAWWSTSRD